MEATASHRSGPGPRHQPRALVARRLVAWRRLRAGRQRQGASNSLGQCSRDDWGREDDTSIGDLEGLLEQIGSQDWQDGANGMTPKIDSWHRRHAIMLASQLPDNSEDGLIILQLAREWTRMAAAAAGGVICGAAGVGKEAACRATPLVGRPCK